MPVMTLAGAGACVMCRILLFVRPTRPTDEEMTFFCSLKHDKDIAVQRLTFQGESPDFFPTPVRSRAHIFRRCAAAALQQPAGARRRSRIFSARRSPLRVMIFHSEACQEFLEFSRYLVVLANLYTVLVCVLKHLTRESDFSSLDFFLKAALKNCSTTTLL